MKSYVNFDVQQSRDTRHRLRMRIYSAQELPGSRLNRTNKYLETEVRTSFRALPVLHLRMANTGVSMELGHLSS